MKKFTKEQVNNFTEDEYKRLVISYGDGQGDTYIKTLYDLDYGDDCVYKDKYGNMRKYTQLDNLKSLFEELGGNMVNIRWIENNRLVKVDIIDLFK